jgi:hypothetical protein
MDTENLPSRFLARGSSAMDITRETLLKGKDQYS